jgi:hypothetical protein
MRMEHSSLSWSDLFIRRFAMCYDITSIQFHKRATTRGERIALLAASLSRSCGFVFLVGAAHDDLQRVVRQWPLQCLSLVPRRAHPDVALCRFVRERKEAMLACSDPMTCRVGSIDPSAMWWHKERERQKRRR